MLFRSVTPALGVDKPAALASLDQERLILLHLREGVPHVVAVEGGEVVVEHARSLQGSPILPTVCGRAVRQWQSFASIALTGFRNVSTM